MSETWYYASQWSRDIAEREVLSRTAKFITPKPDGHLRPHRQSIAGWYSTREAAVTAKREQLETALRSAKLQAERAEAKLAEFEFSEKARQC